MGTITAEQAMNAAGWHFDLQTAQWTHANGFTLKDSTIKGQPYTVRQQVIDHLDLGQTPPPF